MVYYSIYSTSCQYLRNICNLRFLKDLFYFILIKEVNIGSIYL